MAVTAARLRQCALQAFPWGGKSKKLMALKGSSLIRLLFADPSYFDWSLNTARSDENWHWLAEEMALLLRAIATVPPVIKCGGGQAVTQWSLCQGKNTGHYVMCDDPNCCCHSTGASLNTLNLLPHTFQAVLPCLAGYGREEERQDYVKWFKKDHGLPPPLQRDGVHPLAAR